MKANITTYQTNARVYSDTLGYDIDYDFQSRDFFDSEKEQREWIDEVLEPIKDCDNYEDIAVALGIATARFVNSGYVVRFERLDADNGILETFGTLKEAVDFCDAHAKGEEKATGESDKCPQIRWYVVPSIFDETEGPDELYSTDWYWWRGI